VEELDQLTELNAPVEDEVSARKDRAKHQDSRTRSRNPEGAEGRWILKAQQGNWGPMTPGGLYATSISICEITGGLILVSSPLGICFRLARDQGGT